MADLDQIAESLSSLTIMEAADLAKLPSMDALRGMIIGLLLAPATKLVRLIAEPGAQLARLVEARRAQQEEG